VGELIDHRIWTGITLTLIGGCRMSAGLEGSVLSLASAV
jgi:hypothetical protein